ncbi:General transcription and DNA repair factor IIH subunit tcf-29 [Hyphodiscus hymeniophilus]|uniref:General transcription and DNA repair factor IIH subunit tcf-29 n=1 Tax=Hyphodiscus hymeniophilus TaxID=353542 RepID=A0A9P7B184_9HELO|nr:General transcription and DNA repair factor IIH subunit tcf-29 [Hyphodiscus hymeniophilus]
MTSSKLPLSIAGSAAYKKQPGTLSIPRDRTSVKWTPLDAGSSVSIAMSHITNFQQTPETAAKVILKFYEKQSETAEAVAHTFTFDSPSNPRGEANAIKDVLTPILAATKAAAAANANDKPKGAGSASAAMAIASAVASKPTSGTARWYDDTQLKIDIELQQSLMKKDPALNRTYMESRRTKPDTISDSQFNTQFWSTRTNVLRAHAVETNQKRGQYNVLSAVKPRQVDGELKMNISAEQVQLIFSQHPLVKRVYDENVPKLNEMDFWSRFFLSRLFKKLKGERINPDTDATDPTFDRYLEASNDMGPSQRLLSSHIPHIIDLQGNEENQGGSKDISGNRQDWTMRPTDVTKIPIVRTLNSLSEKIMAHVAPSDVDPADPIGMDEGTFNSLALRDLQGDEQENRIMLNIKEQSRFFSSEKSEISAEAASYASQVPREVLSELQIDIDPSLMNEDDTGRYELRTAIGVMEDSDSEDDGEAKVAHVGSKASLMDAQKQIFEGIVARRSEMDGSSAELSLSGLSQRSFDRLVLTHATTTEFLHHFWVIFLSGDPDRAGELAKMVETLERAMDRINAVATDAEKERNELIISEKQRIKDLWEQTGKKKRFDPNSVGGGEKVVREMMEPTIKTLQKAAREYRKALVAEGIDTT